MLETLKKIKGKQIISEKEAERIIQSLSFGNVSFINYKTAGLITGFHVEVVPLNHNDKKLILDQRLESFKSKMEAYHEDLKKYELKVSELSKDAVFNWIAPLTPPVVPNFEFVVDMSECPRTLVLTPIPEGRYLSKNHEALPFGILKFNDMIKKISEYQVFNVELRGKRPNQKENDERELMKKYEPVFKHQGHVFRAWQEILIDYQLGENSYSFHEMLKDYAHFIGYLVEYRKLANKHLKSEQRLMEIYNEIFSEFNPENDWFEFSLKEAILVSATDTDFNLPEDLSEIKKTFWTQVKDSSKEAKKYFI